MTRLQFHIPFVCAVLLLGACARETAEIAPRPTPVRVQPAVAGPASPAIETNGIVATRDELRLSFLVGGVIARIDVEAGQTVRAGQQLATLELTDIDAQVAQARQLAEQAQRELERGERLHADQVISLEQLEQLRTQAALHRAQLESARFNRRHAVIVAPRDGVVLRRLAEDGETVAAGQPVLVLGARDRGYIVRAALADRELVQLSIGDPAEIRLDAWPGTVFSGRAVELARAADERSGLFPIEVQIDDPPPGIASGLVAKLSISPTVARERQLTHVPIDAVVEGEGRTASVFVAHDGHAQRRSVQIAFFSGDSVALAGGLEPGEPVVTAGALYLEDGAPIEIVDDPQIAAEASAGS